MWGWVQVDGSGTWSNMGLTGVSRQVCLFTVGRIPRADAPTLEVA